MISFDMTVAHAGWKALPDGPEMFVEKVLAALDDRLDGGGVPEEWEISLLLADDATLRPLNRDWRGRDETTNVLSFPVPAKPLSALPGPESSQLLGDVVLAFETVEKEALEQEKSFADHTAHLLVHGALHLLGYDHGGEREAEAMESLEIEILKTLDIANPYQAKSEQGD